MKKFAFRLDRVLEWRKTQERLEEIKLESLHADLMTLESRRRGLEDARSRAFLDLVRAGSVTGFDLAMLDTYRKSAGVQASRLTAERRELDGLIAKQIQELAGRRRDVRLIERLREQKFEKWRGAFQQEIDREAEEIHLSKFARTQPAREP